MNKQYFLFICCLFLALLFASTIHAQDYERVITRAYEDILGRQPDRDGMRHFRSKMIDDGWDEKRVRTALRESEEYRLHQIDVVINRAYDDLLRRKPDKQGLDNYRQKMLREGWDEQRVRKSIMDSEEYKRIR